MDNHFQKTIKSWQTVLFFVILLGSAVFIGSVFGLGGYVAETDLLVVASNPQVKRTYNYGDLGQTLKVVLREDAFHKLLQDKFNLDISDNKIRVKHHRETDILQIRVKGRSVSVVQKNIKNIHQTIITYAPEYYSPNDKVIVKTLKAPQIIDNYTLAWQRGLEGAVAGLLMGLLIVWLTDFRLDLSLRNKSPRAIIRQKLKTELERSHFKKELEPELEEYVFSAKGLLKNGQLEIDKKNKTVARKQKKVTIKPRFIALNTFLNDDLKAKRQKEIIPDNLPVFTEEKYNDEVKSTEKITKDKILNKAKSINSRKSTIKKSESIVPKEEKQTKKRPEGKGKEIVQQTKKVVSSLEKSETKNHSAHNIANGFIPPVIPNVPADEDLNPAEIKDRLNRLLRGDL